MPAQYRYLPTYLDNENAERGNGTWRVEYSLLTGREASSRVRLRGVTRVGNHFKIVSINDDMQCHYGVPGYVRMIFAGSVVALLIHRVHQWMSID